MDMTSLDKLMEPLQGADLDQAHLDLPSWLLGDEVQLGFCDGAKEMHSRYSELVGHASPPFITSDISDLDIYDQIDWNKPLSLEDCFLRDLKEQVEELPTAPDSLRASAVTPERQDERRTSPTPSALYDGDLGSAEQPSPEVLLHWTGAIPAFVPPKELESNVKFSDISPQVISVPISDAVSKPTSAVKEVSPQFKSEAPPVVIVKRIPTTAFSQTSEPQKIVINLKRVSVVPKSSTPLPNASPLFNKISVESFSSVEESYDGSITSHPRSLAPSLKEASSRDNTSPQLLDLVKPVLLEEPVSPSISIIEDPSQYVETDLVDHDGISIASPSAESIGAEMTYEELTEDSGVFLLSPESISNKQLQSPPHITSSLKAVKSSERKSRPSPYSPMEKKLRKKEQNKRAALRYRQKKKEEEDSIFSLLQREEARQKDLKEKYDSLQMEMRLLKNLMREVIAKKKFNNLRS
jgi:hypothetical protein